MGSARCGEPRAPLTVAHQAAALPGQGLLHLLLDPQALGRLAAAAAAPRQLQLGLGGQSQAGAVQLPQDLLAQDCPDVAALSRGAGGCHGAGGATEPLACHETCGRRCSRAQGTGASPAPPPGPASSPAPTPRAGPEPEEARPPKPRSRFSPRRGRGAGQAGALGPAAGAGPVARADTWRVGSARGEVGEGRGPPGVAQTSRVTSDTRLQGPRCARATVLGVRAARARAGISAYLQSGRPPGRCALERPF